MAKEEQEQLGSLVFPAAFASEIPFNITYFLPKMSLELY